MNAAQFGEETAITFPAEESKPVECRDRWLSELDEQELVPWCRGILDRLAGINDPIVYDLQAEVRNITVEIGNTSGLDNEKYTPLELRRHGHMKNVLSQ